MSNSFIMTESIVRPAKMPYGRLKDNGFIGIEGEHAARALVVETKDDLSAFASINLIINDLDCGAMTKTSSGSTATLSKVLTSSMIGRSGKKICQLIMVNSDNTVVQKSSQFEAYVGRTNEIERSVDDGVTIIILSEAVTEMAREAAAAASITVDATLTQTGQAADAAETGRQIGLLKADLESMDGRVETLEQSSSGLSYNAQRLLITILTEGMYGSNQADNITRLRQDLLGHDLVSINAECNETPIVGTAYSDIPFIVTATYSDDTTSTVTTYVVTEGVVVEGSNTVTITYDGLTTTCVVTGSSVVTYTVTYNLAGVESSNTTTIVAEDSAYSTELSAMDDYTFSDCTVTMGGIDITSTALADMGILITNVTGNIVITASAILNEYMDALIPVTSGGVSQSFAYSDYFETELFREFYYGRVYVTEYPSANACRIKWVLRNTTDAEVSIAKYALGCIPVDDDSYVAGANKIAYAVALRNASGTLGPGASVEGYYDLRAGYQLAFLASTETIDSLELKLIGAFEPMNVTDGYTRLSFTYRATGSYRRVTWYSDDGTTPIVGGSDTRNWICTETFSAGTYSLLWRRVVEAGGDAKEALGAVDASVENFTTVNNCAGLSGFANTWYSAQTFVISDSSHELIAFNGDSSYELYIKAVS